MPMMFPVKDMSDERLLEHWEMVRDYTGSIGDEVKVIAREEMERRGLEPGPVFSAPRPGESW